MQNASFSLTETIDDLPSSNNETPKNKQEIIIKNGQFTGTQMIATICLGCIFSTVGIAVGYPGICIPYMVNGTNSTDAVIEKDEIAIFSSILAIGCIVGSISAVPLTVVLGQKNLILLLTPISIGSWITFSQTNSSWLLLLSRFVNGITLGAFSGSSPTYVGEISHCSLRGPFLATVNFFMQLGILAVYIVGSLTSSWRHIALICGIAPFIIAFPILLKLPHSPRWLATRGRFEEARLSLSYYRVEEYDVDKELEEILRNIVDTKSNIIFNQFKLLKKNSIRKLTTILAVLNCLAHFPGGFALLSYAITLFIELNSGIDEYTGTILCGVMRCLGNVFVIFIIDKSGRKASAITSVGVCGILSTVLAIFYYIKESQLAKTSHLEWLPLCCAIIMFFMFSILWSSIISMRTELFPNNFRTIGTGITLVAYYSGVFLSTFIYPYVVEWGGSMAGFASFSVSSFLTLALIAFSIPETKGKSLEDIERFFN